MVSLIVVNYNALEYLDGCLGSIFAQTYKNFEVVLFDNASTDVSALVARKKFPQVRVILNDTNVGYAGAVNLASKLARGSFLAFLNPDVQLDPDWLKNLVQASSAYPEGSVYGSKVMNWSSRDVIENAGFETTFYGTHFIRGLHEIDRGQYDKVAEVFYVSGSAFFVRSEIFRELGGFDARYFLYGDESDFCWRAQLLGHRILFIPTAKVYHARKGSVDKKKRASLWISLYYGRRNLLCSMLKNQDLPGMVLALTIRLFIDISSAILTSLNSKSGESIIVVLRAIWWNLRNLRATLEERRRIRCRRRVGPSIVKKHMLKGIPYLTMFRAGEILGMMVEA
jgi:hypothetical protein